jgi:hypothetical protein
MQRRYVGSTVCMGSTPAIRAEALRSSARRYRKNAVSENSDGILEMVDAGILGFRIIILEFYLPQVPLFFSHFVNNDELTPLLITGYE